MIMSDSQIIIFSLTIYKVVTILSGSFFAYMGYKLFIHGIFQDAGELKTNFKNMSLVLKKAAPGTFFVVLGSIIVCTSLWKGLNYEPDNETGMKASGVMPGSRETVQMQNANSSTGEIDQILIDIALLNRVESDLVLNSNSNDQDISARTSDQDKLIDLISRTKVNLMLFVWQNEWGDPNEFVQWAGNEPGYYYSDPPTSIKIPVKIYKGIKE